MKRTRIRFLGGTRGIGNTSIMIQSDSEAVLLDYGTTPSNKFEKPKNPPSTLIRSIILSHAHLDHSGAVPCLYKSVLRPALISTPLTMELANLLIRDMVKILRNDVPFTNLEINRMLSSFIPVNYGNAVKIGDNFIVTLFNAGHIPGSASILVEIKGKKIWYTGDINLAETRLLRAAEILENADIVIMETTYADKEHPNRRDEEKRFIRRIEEIIQDKGTILIPAFSVGRSQEIITILYKNGYRGPLAIDGMAKTATEIILRYPEYLKKPEDLEHAIRKVKWIKNRIERKKLLRKPGIIVAPAGMLGGGWSEWYLKHIYNGDRNAVFFVSFQILGTMGHQILNERKFVIHGREYTVRAQVEQFEFSGHSGKSELLDIVRKLEKPERIFLIHGEEETINSFKEELIQMGLPVTDAEVGREYSF